MHSSGEFEIYCHPAETARVHGSAPSFEKLSPGDRLGVLFIPPAGAVPPYSFQVRSPSGELILDRVMREAPTGEPQSAAPVEFVASSSGDYTIIVKQLSSGQRGEMNVKVG